MLFNTDKEVTFVSELSTKPAQKLSKYSWYGNVRLQRFHIPEETAIARWLFSVNKVSTFPCGTNNVTIYLRWGAPPVVSLKGSIFPNSTLWSPSLSLTLPVASQNSTTVNLTYPSAGDWYVAAHLPEDDGRIEQKGFPSCSYVFQPQLSIRRAVDVPILQQGALLQQTATPEKPSLFLSVFRLYVPEFVSSLSVSVADCSSSLSGSDDGDCPLILKLGSSAPLQHSQVTVNCSGTGCSAVLLHPPWDTWLRVVVESNQDNRTVNFSIASYSTGDSRRFYLPSVSVPAPSPGCLWNVPVLYEEADVLSLRYSPVKGPNVNVTDTHPTLLSYPLPTQATGGTLNLQLTINAVSMSGTVCYRIKDPPCVFCADFSAGYRLVVNASVPKAVLRLPFPQSATWYLTLQLIYNSESRGPTVVQVAPEVSVSACVDDCGTYGECRLLRSYSYLYSACVCKAGWDGWGCTDGSKAQSYLHQVTATLLLTLSNLFFLPVIVVAIKRYYFTEASVYLFTMFFSTFYHACDQPGVAVACIMDYDTLQYCDFLGSVCCIWVTILCMARIRDLFKYSLFMLGTLLIAMSMQLDRKGLWNLLGPVLCALVIMVTAWVYRGLRRNQCYPPGWRRWVFFLLPGITCALIGICLYVFGGTEKNYYYTHSLWHILMASCVVFLLWALSWKPRVCGYTLCENGKDELYTVT
uniref:Post-glycosylphosphatidylinositol attachment to proteins 6 n=1 Tax=Cynoglossus semilaevis TaxID=244447 RepID=A0A3P8WT99_CYNSE